MASFIKKSITALRSPRGRDTLMFLLFVLISFILWGVMALNDERQYDVRLPMKITNVPDSVTIIAPGPEALSVSLSGQGSQMLKMTAGKMPTVNIDFRAFRSQGAVRLSSADLKGLIRTATGSSQVNVVYPDTLLLPYTTHAGYRLPVMADYRATAGPQAALTGRPRLSADSVSVYMTSALPDDVDEIRTEPLRLLGIDRPTTRRVKLIAPAGARVIPDSIDISFDVEPLIFKSRKVVIEPVNVPEGIKLITFPAQIDVYYMVTAADYSKGDNHMRVVADYKGINRDSRKLKLTLKDVPHRYQNVYMSTDSAEYIIERR